MLKNSQFLSLRDVTIISCNFVIPLSAQDTPEIRWMLSVEAARRYPLARPNRTITAVYTPCLLLSYIYCHGVVIILKFGCSDFFDLRAEIITGHPEPELDYVRLCYYLNQSELS